MLTPLPKPAKRDKPPRSLSTARILEVRERDAYTCQHPGCYMRVERGEPHHIRSRAQFGSKRLAERDAPANLVTLCWLHHQWAQLQQPWRNYWCKASEMGLLGEAGRQDRERQTRGGGGDD